MPESWDYYQPHYRPATSADIFAGFEVSAQVNWFIEDPERPFSMEMTLAAWADATDCFDYKEFKCLRQWLADTYQAQIDPLQWRALVRSSDQVTLGDICEFVVSCGGWMLDPLPLRIAGRDCEEAGVFLTLRAAMYHAGGAAQPILPSTSIDEVMRSNPDYFGTLLYQSCPPLVGQITTESALILKVLGQTFIRVLPKSALSFLLSYTGLAVFVQAWNFWLYTAAALLLSMIALCWLPPSRMGIGSMESMADLSREIALRRHEAQPVQA